MDYNAISTASPGDQTTMTTPTNTEAIVDHHKELRDYYDSQLRYPCPDERYIREYYRSWGLGDRCGEERKEHLMGRLLAVARRDGWVYGLGTDTSKPVGDLYRRVVYIDTPEGQVSFHVFLGGDPSLPEYLGTWSGKRDSEEILVRLANGGLF